MFLLDATAPTSVLDYIQSGGIIAILLISVWAFLTRKAVPGWTYDAMVEERDYYRELAHKGTELADRQMTIAETLTARMGVLETRRDIREDEDLRRGRLHDER